MIGLLTVLLAAAGLVAPVAPPAAAATPATIASQAYARMTTAQRIGQLIMAAVPSTGSSSALRSYLAQYHVGNVILIGQTTAGVSNVATVVAPVRRTTTQAKVLPYVAVDQEGGLVQHLKGTGFSTMPTALQQGQIDTTTLRGKWRRWGNQLQRAGINLDLAPVADIVPASIGTANKPIGQYYREYGHTRTVVGPHVAAAVHGIHDAGIGSTVKHFPGLGRATGNTDTMAGVTDPTFRHGSYIKPFARAINAGAPVVMVSTAIYPNIAPNRIGAFSHLIVTTMLRHDLGFGGLIISDSLTAKSVSHFGFGTRAIRSLKAGVDVLLVTDNTPIKAMTSAIASRMKTDTAFRSVVKAAVMHVLTAKARAGLITA